MTRNILILGGDGIGPETVAEAEKVLGALVSRFGLDVAVDHALVGGAAIDVIGMPLPEETLDKALASDAVLFGAIGGPKWDGIDRALRPERGLLALRSKLGLFANLRPVTAHPALAQASTMKPEVIAGLNIMIVRELTGGIYFGEPRGFVTSANGVREGFNTLRYNVTEIERIARVAFEIAATRRCQVCSVDKANVLEVSELWREVVESVARSYPAITLRHMYVDNAAMQLVRDPKQFDVIVTDNMFGDILSDLASMLGGSIGMLPSASLDAHGRGLYEPIHGSAPDIAGRDLANPLAAILSLAMLLRHSLREHGWAEQVEQAVGAVLDAGLRTADIAGSGGRRIGTREMGDAVVRELLAQAGK
ncbi:MAG: 3-isopropylmalate dehydrogenase [Gammaproteobacteria bacterium]|nr:3-isopropylmalate dehydrogenase [Gammaproteobacteria bacterium]